MMVATEMKVDEQGMLRMLEIFIEKQREVATLRHAVNEQHRRLSACETAERSNIQQVSQLEGRLKAVQTQTMYGTVKVGEVSSLKQQLSEAKDNLLQRRQEVDEQRDVLVLGQEAIARLMTELDEQRPGLRSDLSQLFLQRFPGDHSALIGKRGQVCWMDADPNSPDLWRKQWRSRAFRVLLNVVLDRAGSEASLCAAFFALFRRAPFHVRVQSGFSPAYTKCKHPFSIGELIAVPDQLSEEDAFEEIVRRRVAFVSEHELVTM